MAEYWMKQEVGVLGEDDLLAIETDLVKEAGERCFGRNRETVDFDGQGGGD